MTSASDPIPLASIGVDAARVLSAGARGTVAAVFHRSLYARFDPDWICFGDVATGNGPLNALVPSRSFAPWRERVAMGDAIEIADIGRGESGVWRIRVREAEIWRTPICHPMAPGRIRLRLEELPHRLPGGIPDEGLACFIWHPALPRSPVAQSAAASIQTLLTWVSARDRENLPRLPEALGWLIGLGPGLTPSGDDFLAGALATLHGLGRRDDADALWRLIEPLTPEATHPISISFLRAAARGGLSESLAAILLALVGDAEWPRLDCWPDLGHSSPWDALAGVATVLRASVSALEWSDSLNGH